MNGKLDKIKIAFRENIWLSVHLLTIEGEEEFFKKVEQILNEEERT
jgi:hypothetical protein